MRISSTILSAILATSGNAGLKAGSGEPGRGTNKPAAVSVNQLYSQFLIVAQKEISFQDGIRMLEETRTELRIARKGMEFWGQTAIIANASILVLNIIVNSLELKQANSLLKVFYQELAKGIYNKYARSGTRFDGPMKLILGNLKKIMLEELERKGLGEYLPGVTILVGLVEDTMALYQSMEMVEHGLGAGAQQEFMIEQHITRMKRELLNLGIERADLLRRVERRQPIS